MPEFMKHVFPRLDNPHTPLTDYSLITIACTVSSSDAYLSHLGLWYFSSFILHFSEQYDTFLQIQGYSSTLTE